MNIYTFAYGDGSIEEGDFGSLESARSNYDKLSPTGRQLVRYCADRWPRVQLKCSILATVLGILSLTLGLAIGGFRGFDIVFNSLLISKAPIPGATTANTLLVGFLLLAGTGIHRFLQRAMLDFDVVQNWSKLAEYSASMTFVEYSEFLVWGRGGAGSSDPSHFGEDSDIPKEKGMGDEDVKS